ncbi:MAG: polysaccharide biosynthesis C-terminal domain-containing protein [Anaeroplasma sp.]
MSLLYKSIIPFGTATLFFTIYQLIDSITMSNIDPHIYTSYMFEATRLIFIPIVICQSIAGVITPKINYLYSNGNINQAKKLAKKITNLAIIALIPIIFIFMNYSQEIYKIFYKDENYEILKNTAILIFFIGFYKILIGLAQGMPKFELIITFTIFSSIAKLILNVILIKSYNYYGAVISTIIAIFITIIFSYIVLYRGKINILLGNIVSIIMSVLFLYISIFIASILNTLYANSFSDYISIVINIGFIISFYTIFILFIKILLSTKSTNLHKMK